MENQDQQKQPTQQQQPTQPAQVPALAQPTQSERFTMAVEREFSSNSGQISLTSFQRKLIQNYFIKIDMLLKDAEVKRMAKSEQYRDNLAFTWDNVNLPRLAIDVITYSAIGLDPTQPNHLNPIPYKNNKTGKYDITFIVGYKGTEIKAKKYGLDVPDEIVVELVYSKDKFQVRKKDANNKVESYEFEVVDSFDRGEVIGGFYYHNYFNQPERNKLKTFSKADIDKRKPEHASAEFWGGSKANYVNGQKQGTVEVEGWYDEMAYKTIYKAAYNCITIDSEKIDEHYLAVIQREHESKDDAVFRKIAESANKTEIGFTEHEVITPQPQQASQPAPAAPAATQQPETAQPSKAPF